MLVLDAIKVNLDSVIGKRVKILLGDYKPKTITGTITESRITTKVTDTFAGPIEHDVYFVSLGDDVFYLVDSRTEFIL